MKKITVLVLTMVFTITVGLAYAGEGLHNGVTDFSGRSYDTLEISSTAALNSVGAVSAGGLRAEGKALYNGVTDFSGRSYDIVQINSKDAVNSVEGVNAGGLREEKPAGKRSNEIIDSGRSYDTVPMNPALGW